ncbi:hypothetical protein [Pseudoramibacter faecis]|uniref:hypothetical protein n=1 Tax=Pseudoramibacter faecis TaxID=3108534 RepID=UPI002E76FE1E|nr:hypothetical protein [Pseudoramibacter sp. HA2172]
MMKHGKCGTRLYGVWKSMNERCSNPNNSSFADYGGRGITVCNEWNEFQAFSDWAERNGYDETAPFGECTLDRINNNLGYSPEN